MGHGHGAESLDHLLLQRMSGDLGDRGLDPPDSPMTLDTGRRGKKVLFSVFFLLGFIWIRVVLEFNWP